MIGVAVFLANDRPFGVTVNALAHAALGFASLDLTAGGEPEIVSVSGPAIAALRQAAVARGATVVDFTDTMTGGTWREQLERTARTQPQDLNYYALVVAAPQPVLSELAAASRQEAPA